MSIDVSNIPAWLRDIDRWVIWTNDGGKKVPRSAKSGHPVSVTSASAPTPFKQAVTGLRKFNASGIGVVLNGDGLVAVDLDDCLDSEGRFLSGVDDLLRRLGARYVEVSPSGRGLHVLGIQASGERISFMGALEGFRVEMYSDKRFITITGQLAAWEGLDMFDSTMGGVAEVHRWLAGERTSALSHRADRRLTQEIQEKQEFQRTTGTPEEQADGLEKIKIPVDLPSRCVISAPGQRNQACFHLARWTRSIAPDVTLTQCKSLVTRWHDYFVDKMDTKEFSETWTNFCAGWDKIHTPYGQDLHEVMAHLPELPDYATDHGLGDKGDLLLRLCLALAGKSDSGQFFLCGHSVAPFLGCTATWIYQLLSAAQALDLLVKVKEGKRGSASEYIIGHALGGDGV